jgi:integrase
VDLLYRNTNQVRRVLHSKLATRFPPGNRERWVRLNSCGDLYTGQRLADIAALTWDNLDLSKNEIRLRTRKTAKRIMVPIAKPLTPWTLQRNRRLSITDGSKVRVSNVTGSRLEIRLFPGKSLRLRAQSWP